MRKKNITIKFSEILKFYRSRTGLSQLDLSILSNVAASSIQKAEIGAITLSEKAKHKIADALKLNPKEHALLCGVNLYITEFEVEEIKLGEENDSSSSSN